MQKSLLRGCNEGSESRLAEMDLGRKIVALFIALAMSSMLPALLLLGTG